MGSHLNKQERQAKMEKKLTGVYVSEKNGWVYVSSSLLQKFHRSHLAGIPAKSQSKDYTRH